MQTDNFNYETWEETMKAIVNGEIELDEGEELATKCAKIADLALVADQSDRKKTAQTKHNADRQPLYSSMMLGNIEGLRKNSILPFKDIERIKKTLIECGKAADAVQDGETVGTTA